MHEKRSVKYGLLLQTLVILAITEQCFSEAYTTQPQKELKMLLNDTDKIGSSILINVQGNVYPKGAYSATFYIGQPAKPYDLDIDTGSDLTWLQCAAPCVKCFPAPHPLYTPSKDNIVKCADRWCALLHLPHPVNCHDPQEQCDYKIEYADGSSLGLLLRDLYFFRLNNGTSVAPSLPLGCGYDQEVTQAPFVDGVLGLGKGKIGIVNQLNTIGITQNVLGHCLTQGGGYFFIGDDFIPSSGIVWSPMSSDDRYTLGPANLQFDGQPTGIQGISVLFDSGSTYTYFNQGIYPNLLNLIKRNIKPNQLRDAPDDGTLPLCWRGVKPFRSILEVKNLFKTLILRFTNSNNQFYLPPEAYLIISAHGNVCLGILNGSEVGLENRNVIGDISFQDQLVIFDNEKQQIGWGPANCKNRLRA